MQELQRDRLVHEEKNSDLIERIKARFSEMSDSQKALAKYLLDNVETAAFLTAGRLGAVVGVSESTVVRFAYALGYQGWPELQRVLQSIVRSKLSTVTRLRLSAMGPSAVLAHEVLAMDLQNLKRTMDELQLDVFDKVVDALVKARNIYVLGSRSAHCLALFLAFYLQMIGRPVRVVPQGVSSIFEELFGAGPEDVVVAISFPRYSATTVQGFRYAKERGAVTVALTDSEVSPLAQLADVTLTARSHLGSFIESFVAPLSVINALVTAVGRRDEDTTLAWLERLEETCGRHAIFCMPEGGGQ
jgi:DNA-binding MurR/RpiR family transcriptional regulator